MADELRLQHLIAQAERLPPGFRERRVRTAQIIDGGWIDADLARGLADVAGRGQVIEERLLHRHIPPDLPPPGAASPAQALRARGPGPVPGLRRSHRASHRIALPFVHVAVSRQRERAGGGPRQAPIPRKDAPREGHPGPCRYFSMFLFCTQTA